mgnify:CR=1 FL=1
MARKTPSATPHTSGRRALRTRVKTAKGRSVSSTRWLERQLNDPYVAQAKQEGYRSRAAYKLIEIDDNFGLLSKGKTVIDLGAAPGGWTQIAARRVLAGTKGGGTVIGIDLQPIEPIPHTLCLQGDFLETDGLSALQSALAGKRPDIVLSDMAASACGHPPTDHIRIMALCEAAFDFALLHLAPGGAFVAKVLRGGAEQTLLHHIKQHFRLVKHFKPPASRADSAEIYIVAKGFKG